MNQEELIKLQIKKLEKSKYQASVEGKYLLFSQLSDDIRCLEKELEQITTSEKERLSV